MQGMFYNWGPTGDFADVGNVIDDDTTGGNAGTYEEVAESDVNFGVTWGEDGTEHTGSGDVLGAASIFFLRRR